MAKKKLSREDLDEVRRLLDEVQRELRELIEFVESRRRPAA